MSRRLGYGILVTTFLLIMAISLLKPGLISNKNTFLLGFVNHEFLNLLGVIIAITLASAGQIHLSLNQIEEKSKKEGFHETRKGLRVAIKWLIGLFMLGLILVIIKPLIPNCDKNEILHAIINGTAVFIVIWYILIMYSMTEAVFAIKPQIE